MVPFNLLKRSSSSLSNNVPKKDSGLFDILLEKKFLAPFQIKTIEQESERLKKPKEEVLEKKGWVSDDKLALAYSLAYDIPIVHLPERLIPQEVLFLIPKEIAQQLQIIPLEVKDGGLKIGIVNPFKLFQNRKILQDLSEKHKVALKPQIIPNSDFRRTLVQYEGESLEPFKKRDFSSISLAGIQISFDVITKLPERIARKYKMAVFGFVPNQLIKIAVVNPTDSNVLEILDFIKKRTGLRVEKYVIEEKDLQGVLEVYRKPPKVEKIPIEAEAPPKPLKPPKPAITVEKVAVPTEEISPEDLTALLKKDIANVKELEEIVKGGHVPKIVAALINFACQKRATDIHAQPAEQDLLIRYRIDGLLRDIIRVPKDLHPAIISRIKILSKLKIDEHRIPQDGRFDLNFHGRGVDIRVSTLPTANGEKAVLRLLDKSFGILTLEQLGLQGKGFKDLVRETQKPHGVILATGPTGCGKSTTLYAIISRVKNPTVNIVTLEDPVEYIIEGVNQSQIRPEINYSFATGLRSILRQDPNIIMVGEIRDIETASMVTHAALTGHLVLTTLHTNEAASALPRLINMGVEPFLITSAINAIIAQRLIRRVCPKCQEEAKLGEAILGEIEKEITKMPKGTLESANLKRPFPIRYGRGCDECDKGYRGRIGILEVLVMNLEIEDLAVRRRPASEIEKAAIRAGMITMKQDGILKVLQGITTYEEILRVTTTD